MRWSDGSPLTAHDFVYSYRRMLDPESTNIYAFFYYDIKNAEAIVKGENEDLESLGVRAVDDTTLVIETEKRAPYLPHIVSFGDAMPVPKRLVDKYGRKWTEPENIITNSGFMVTEWVNGSHMTLVPNPYYNGPHKPFWRRSYTLFATRPRRPFSPTRATKSTWRTSISTTWTASSATLS